MKNKVKEHPRLTKGGRLVKVKEHQRTVSPKDLIKDLKKFKEESKIRIVDFASSKDSSSESNRDNFVASEKKTMLKVFLNHLEPEDPLLKRMAGRYFTEVNSDIKIAFKELSKKKKKKEPKSKLHFGYFADGGSADKLISNGKGIKIGDRLHNQCCAGDKDWGETLERKGLEIIQIMDMNEKNVKYMLMTIKENKKFNTVEKVLPIKKMIKYIKTGALK